MRRFLYVIVSALLVCGPAPRAHAAASHSNAPVVHPPAPTPPPPGPGGGGDDGGGGGPSATTDPICYVDGSVLDTATDVHVRCPELDLVFKRAYDVVARWTYDAWGNVLSEEASVPALASVRYRFQDRERSAATGLINFRMRWYDPVTGRWLSKDPIGLNGGLNLYAFCDNKPVSSMDQFGMADRYVPDKGNHGGPHVDGYRGSQNIGRYKKCGEPIPHKGKIPPPIPKRDWPAFLGAASKLGGLASAIFSVSALGDSEIHLGMPMPGSPLPSVPLVQPIPFNTNSPALFS